MGVSRRSQRPWTRLLLAGAAVLTLLVAGLALPAPARADEVAVAQERVDRLQSLAASTTKTLLDGTRAWEADKVKLRQVELKLSNTRRHVAEAAQLAEAAALRLDALARGVYMRAAPGQLQLAFTQTPDSFIASLQAMESVRQASGGEDRIIAQSQTAQSRLRTEQAAVEQYAQQAGDLVRTSAARMVKLQALARNTAQQLDQAQAALSQALEDKAAREAAAARAQARARASRLRSTARVSGAFCTGRSTSGQQNGNLDPSSLCPLWKAPGHRLRADAAAAFNKMSQYHAATIGGPLCVTDSYRSYSEQAALYERKPGLAAVPGTSNHGWGVAVDFCGGVQNSGSAAYQWMKANAGKFGWFHPDWAEPSGSKPEAWHWEFNG